MPVINLFTDGETERLKNCPSSEWDDMPLQKVSLNVLL